MTGNPSMDKEELYELFAYTDEVGVTHHYYGPFIERKLGDIDTMIAATQKQEKERELDKYIRGPFHVERDHRDYLEYRVFVGKNDMERFHYDSYDDDNLEKVRRWVDWALKNGQELIPK